MEKTLSMSSGRDTEKKKKIFRTSSPVLLSFLCVCLQCNLISLRAVLARPFWSDVAPSPSCIATKCIVHVFVIALFLPAPRRGNGRLPVYLSFLPLSNKYLPTYEDMARSRIFFSHVKTQPAQSSRQHDSEGKQRFRTKELPSSIVT